jgi:hypothetical protein
MSLASVRIRSHSIRIFSHPIRIVFESKLLVGKGFDRIEGFFTRIIFSGGGKAMMMAKRSPKREWRGA